MLRQFNEVVLADEGEANKLDEDEFWEVYATGHIEEELQPQQLQIRGVQNRPLVIQAKQNIQTQKRDYTLTEDDCRRLLNEYPELNAAYELQVMLGNGE